jgi:cobalt/nickel transport system permease protein
MFSIDGVLFDFKRLDQLATGDSVIHCLDPRVKLLVTLLFSVAVVSFGKYEISAMVPFCIFPVAMVVLARLPVGYVIKKVAILCPFAMITGIFNPLLDRDIILQLGHLPISGGWVSFASIMLRSALTVSAAVILLSVTGFPAICRAMEKFGMPPVFAVQLLFIYRYIAVLSEEGGRGARARRMRASGKRGLGIKTHGSLLGHLLLRTWFRAERIHMAMLIRGFTGEFHTRHIFRFRRQEYIFLLGWAAAFVMLRLHNLPQALGVFVTGFSQ